MVGFLNYADGLYCHAGPVTHAGEIEAGIWLCLCLSCLVLLLSVETGIGRGRTGDFLPDLSTSRCYLQSGDDGVRTLSIVLLPTDMTPIETSVYLKPPPIIHAGSFQSF